ncbi:MAG: hypothetical protein QM601_07205 [Pseudoxanthomonas sp.]
MNRNQHSITIGPWLAEIEFVNAEETPFVSIAAKVSEAAQLVLEFASALNRKEALDPHRAGGALDAVQFLSGFAAALSREAKYIQDGGAA